MNAGDHRANQRQLKMIISVEANLICRGQRVLAVWAAFCNARDDPVWIGGQRPEHPGAAPSLVRRASLGPAGLASLRWRNRGVVRGLGWPTQFRLELGNPPGQFLDLCCLRQDPRHQLFFGELSELILIHPKVESDESPSVKLNLCAPIPPPTKCVATLPRPSLSGPARSPCAGHALPDYRNQLYGTRSGSASRGGVSSYLWRTFENWKRALTKVVETQVKTRQSNVQLFDFSGYNEFTTEHVPLPGDRHSAMRWYWEAGHYKAALGDEMLGVIFGDAAPFGVALTSSNVEQVLAEIRKSRSRFAPRDGHRS
jgi:hypothetical protein